jgi:hypothetical protein
MMSKNTGQGFTGRTLTEKVHSGAVAPRVRKLQQGAATITDSDCATLLLTGNFYSISLDSVRAWVTACFTEPERIDIEWLRFSG